jgi:hypothetical protein
MKFETLKEIRILMSPLFTIFFHETQKYIWHLARIKNVKHQLTFPSLKQCFKNKHGNSENEMII